MRDLLDPTNDYVFKRLFAEAPELLVALINDLRPDLPDIASVEILNPNIEPSELTGKSIPSTRGFFAALHAPRTPGLRCASSP